MKKQLLIVTSLSIVGSFTLSAQNTNNGQNSAIVAGVNNTIQANARNVIIGAGNGNTVESAANNSSIFTGASNTIAAQAGTSVIAGGWSNTIGAASRGSFIGGGTENRILAMDPTYGNFMNSIIGGGLQNTIEGTAPRGTIGGGQNNTLGADAYTSVIAGGGNNRCGARFSAILGGIYNETLAEGSVVGGGQENITEGTFSVIFGGIRNSTGPFASNSVVAGGVDNLAEGASSVISGGNDNETLGNFSMVPGGRNCYAGGSYSFAAGRNASANHTGSFVWGDSTDEEVESTAENQVTFRAVGGVRFISSYLGIGVELQPASTSWSTLSDRDSKENFQEIDPREVLEKVSQLPVTQWNYKHDPDRLYIGPTSQDFAGVFGLGADDKSIATIDTDGVLLAAVQGLVEELKDRDAQLDELKSQIQELRDMMNLPPPPAGETISAGM